MQQAIRFLGFFVLAGAAIAVFIVLAPRVPTSTPTLNATQYQSLIEEALSADRVNNTTVNGAAQQAVVNGWTARDLLTIIAKENQDILTSQGAVVDATGTLRSTPFDERIPALLVLAVVALCWGGISATPTTILVERREAPVG